MRLKKGTKVEVLNKREMPLGSWCCAEIISGNGHTYSVRYNHYLPDIGLAVEKVRRKAIRPCPPPMGGSRSWVPGDIVEVYVNNSWKPAEVSRVVDGGNYFFVRLSGPSKEFKVHTSDLRLRQSWQDNKWVVIDKESGKCNDGKIKISSEVGKFSHRKRQPCAAVKNCGGDDLLLDKNDHGFEEPYRNYSRGMKKRTRFCLPNVGTYTGAGRKMGTVKKEEKHQRLVAAHSSHLREKVDAVASPRIMLGEKYMHASLHNCTTGCPELILDWGKPNDDAVQCFVGTVELNDSESLLSSVGSCSPYNSPYRSAEHLKSSPTQDMDIHFDDAEASSRSGREPSVPTTEGVTTEIHQLEFNAYHSTMVALHASGPLSWEREALLTNLRLMLHITNDEHLLGLRHLASIKSDPA